jgi:hypothetical protein
MFRQIVITLFISCLALAVLPGCISGVGTSRWAMDDPTSAEKYDDPYPSNDAAKLKRMLKQSADARHAAGRGGLYTGLAANDDPFSLGAEPGYYKYHTSMIEGRAGLKGLVGTSAESAFPGGDFGVRLQPPSRLAPFVGAGIFAGANSQQVDATADRIGNDGDTRVDEFGETNKDYAALVSFYPETGFHCWINGSTRLTSSVQYHVTPQGPHDDFRLFGVTLSFLP